MAPSGLMSADPSGSSSRQDEPTGDVGARSCSSQDRVTGTALPLTITMSIFPRSAQWLCRSQGGGWGGKRGKAGVGVGAWRMYFGYLQASEGSWGAPWQSKGRPKRLPGRAQRLYTEEGGNISRL